MMPAPEHKVLELLDERERLRAEVERLETALRQVERAAGETVGDEAIYEAVTDITRAALRQHEERLNTPSP